MSRRHVLVTDPGGPVARRFTPSASAAGGGFWSTSRRRRIATFAVAAAAAGAAIGAATGPRSVADGAEVSRAGASSGSAITTTSALGAEDLVMVFSGIARRGGDLFKMFGNGRVEAIDSPLRRADLYPSFVRPVYQRRGRAVMVERRSLKTNSSRLVYLALPNMRPELLGPGAYPAADPTSRGTSRIAFLERRGTGSLVFSDIGTDFFNRAQVGAPIGRIAFDAGGRFAYVLTDEDALRLFSYDSTGELGEIEIHTPNEDVYLAVTSDRPDSAVVLRACCTAGGYRDAALTDWGLAEVSGAATGDPSVRHLVSLNELGLSSDDLILENLRLAPAGTLDADVADNGRISWSVGAERAWILGYGIESWLIDDAGEITALGEIANGGLAVVPKLLR